MPSPMIEKAARALEPWLKNYPPSVRTKRAQEAARAILLAIREADGGTYLAGAPYIDAAEPESNAKTVWQAQIDHILGA